MLPQDWTLKDNTYQYIHFTSNHPKSILKGVTIGEAIQQTNQVYSPVTQKSLPPHFINRTLKKSAIATVLNTWKQSTSQIDKFSPTNTQTHSSAKSSPPIKRIILNEYTIITYKDTHLNHCL